MIYWITYSDDDSQFSETIQFLETKWVSPEDRVILEKLDARLVIVTDQLFEQLHKHPKDSHVWKSRIERRLYVFPFLCIHDTNLHNKVSEIVAHAVEVIHPNS